MTLFTSKRERTKALENVFSQMTLRTIFKMSSQHYFDELKSPISIGKEANVFSARKGDKTVAVKIYRTNANFKKMKEYMLPDPRFTGLQGTKIGIIHIWARKEYRNLLRARASRVRVPTPYAVCNNVLVMELIGDEEAAPQLNKQHPENPERFFKEIMENVRILYNDAQLIHTDLSAFNILNNHDHPVLIDFSHAIGLTYPNSKIYIKRDIENICNYFKKKFKLETNAEEEYKKCTAKN